MKRGKTAVILALLLLPMFISGCTEKKKLAEVEKTQEEILTKITTIEKNQEKILNRSQPKKPIADFSKVSDIPIGKSPIKGNKDAPVTIVEFSDFQCSFCVNLQPTLKKVLETYPEEVKLVYKHFPLSFHAQAKNAAKASQAAEEQGKFWEMHDLIFEHYNTLTEKKFKEFAEKLGLNVKQFEADYNSNKYDKQIQQDIDIAKNVNVRGTPTLFINGKKMGNRSFNDFKEAIDKILNKPL
ncbi:MAG: DsbA family protein [Candidatus Mariimomonas ferrooxydans]